MRTPAAMTVGLVLAPCGLLLCLVSTLTPGWRQATGFLDRPVNFLLTQGLWDICSEQSSQDSQCGLPDELGYYEAAPVRAARALTVTGLATTAVGLLLATLGVRCWRTKPCAWLAGVSGLVLFAAGLLELIPVSWYTHVLQNRTVLPAQASPVQLRVGYSVVLGFLGSCLLLMGGFSLALSLAQVCVECCAGRPKAYPNPRRSSLNSVRIQWPEAPSISGILSQQSQSRLQPQNGPKPRVGFRMPRPAAYTNPEDVLKGEQSSRRHLSSSTTLPCDSDL
ncbi:claudin-23 [Monodelphis domestica]|uniref:claudin-23 n=1 Tax=Monodelphis domestica TaxID=13616 RepID=UPI0000F2D3D9|nr:claudin-23 [Monodelphis domestica]